MEKKNSNETKYFITILVICCKTINVMRKKKFITIRVIYCDWYTIKVVKTSNLKV